MARQHKSGGERLALDAALDRLTASTTERFGIKPRQARRCWTRLVEAFPLPPTGDADVDDLSYRLARFPGRLFEEALDAMPAEQAARLIEEADLVVLARRVTAVDVLLDPDVPFYTLGEWADGLEAFLAFLDEHRDCLVRHGLPPRAFRENRWLYRRLGRLYDTRATSSPWPHEPRCQVDEDGKALASPAAAGVPPYTWVRAGSSIDASDIRPCAYEEADLLHGMRRLDADLIEAGRPGLFALKRKVVQSAFDAICRRDTSRLEPEFLLAQCKSAGVDVELCLRLDRFYLGGDARAFSPASGLPQLIPGGLTDLLELAGHVTKELRTRTVDRAKQDMPPAVLERLTGSPTGELVAPATYFAAVGHPDCDRLDGALDRLSDEAGGDQDFWTEYQRRLRAALDPEVRVHVGFGVLPKHREVLTTHLQVSADWLAGKLEEQGWVFSVPPPGLCVFHRDGNSWSICFEGKLVAKPDAVGLFYIACLLAVPNRRVSASVLRGALHLFKVASGYGRKELVDTVEAAMDKGGDEGESAINAAGDDLGAAFGEAEEKGFNKEVQRLEEGIAAAIESGRPEAATALQTELVRLRIMWNKDTRGDGQPRRLSAQAKKDLDAVRNATDRVRPDLAVAHKALQEHLQRYLQIGPLCVYQMPEPPLTWEL